MNQKNRKILVIIISLLIVIGILFILFSLVLENKEGESTPPPKPNIEDKDKPKVELDVNQEKVVAMSNDFHSYLLNENKNESDMEKLTGISNQYFVLMMSDRSSLRAVYPEEYKLKVKFDFDKANKIQERYLNKIYEKIRQTYSYKLVDIPLYTEDKKQLMQQTTINPFSYDLLDMDVAKLQAELAKMANVNEFKETPETMLTFYKARIKALEIISIDLSPYMKAETVEANMIYDIHENGEITCENCHTYINYCTGSYSDKLISDDGVDYYNKYYQNRIDNIIKKAEKKGILNVKKPLDY